MGLSLLAAGRRGEEGCGVAVFLAVGHPVLSRGTRCRTNGLGLGIREILLTRTQASALFCSCPLPLFTFSHTLLLLLSPRIPYAADVLSLNLSRQFSFTPLFSLHVGNHLLVLPAFLCNPTFECTGCPWRYYFLSPTLNFQPGRSVS